MDGRRGRPGIAVSQPDFTKVVAEVEAAQTFTSRSALWDAVAATPYAKAIGLTAQVAALRAKQWNLTVNTPLGRKGFVKGATPTGPKKAKRKGKLSADFIRVLTARYGKNHPALVKRACNGNKTALVSLKCIDCSNDQKKEIRLCTINYCPLYPIRPYKGKRTTDLEDSPKKVTLNVVPFPTALVPVALAEVARHAEVLSGTCV
jgi:hypothetical protein